MLPFSRRLACAGVFAFSGLLGSTGPARAQAAAGESAPRTLVENCPDELVTRLPALTKLEIDVLLRERGPTRAPPERIAFRCEEDAARIEVTMAGAARSSVIQ